MLNKDLTLVVWALPAVGVGTAVDTTSSKWIRRFWNGVPKPENVLYSASSESGALLAPEIPLDALQARGQASPTAKDLSTNSDVGHFNDGSCCSPLAFTYSSSYLPYHLTLCSCSSRREWINWGKWQKISQGGAAGIQTALQCEAPRLSTGSRVVTYVLGISGTKP